MGGFERRRGVLAIGTVTMLLLSVGASAVGATYLYGSKIINNQAPLVQVTTLANEDVVPAGPIELRGSAVDKDGKIRAVLIRVDGGSPIPAVLESNNDVSSWSVLLDAPDPGNHTIEVEAVDDLGKTELTEMSVTVSDAAGAVTIPSNVIVEATGPSGAAVNYQLPTVQENIRIVGGFDCLPSSGSMFPIGTTLVTCTASFASGRVIAANFTISVRDSSPPDIVAPRNVNAKNSGEAFVKVSLGNPIVDDIVDTNPVVTNNAPANGFPLGTTTVVWTAYDDYGNTATALQKVKVTAVVSDTGSSSNDENGSGSTTYSGGGGGGGSSGSSGKDQSGKDGAGGAGTGGGTSDNGGGSTPATHTLTVKSLDLSGNSISVAATIKAANGTTLQTGSTPLTFTGAKSDYTVTMTNYDETVFDHWENQATAMIREITLNKDTTVTAYYNVSATTSDAVAPVVTAAPSGGTYTTSKSVTLSSNEPATIYYTTNGNTPTTSSSVYSSPISISATTTLKYFARDAVGNSGSVVTQVYTIDKTAPSVTATPAGGTYSSTQSVTLAASETATIYYTTNGNTPTTSSATYNSALSISSTTTLKYFARDTAGNSGAVATQVYIIDKTAPTVTASPSGGTYSSAKSVTLTVSEPATIYYTTNGNNPSTSSPVYSSPISITSTTTLKYFARDTVGNSGGVVTQTYTITSDTTAPTVTANPVGGTYTSTQSITLTASEPATIYYTTNGNTPSTSSSVYGSPISISSTTALKYFARDAAGNSGNVVTQTYTINAGDTTAPSVAIIDPDANSEVAATDGEIVVSGTSSDIGSGIEIIEVRVDDGDYVEAIPAATGDWSSWSVTLQVTAGERRLVPRATDNAGNQAWNSIYVTVTDPSSGGGGSGTLDNFGIEKVYPTASGGNEWYVNMNDPDSDPNFKNLPSMTKQSDGSWRVSASQVRMEAWSPANEKWLNVEITMYAKMVGGSNELVQLYSRGGHHFSDSSKWCEGSAYKARLYGDGEARWVKELTHPSYTGNRGSVQATDTPLVDRWVGFKAVIYNFVENGKTYVRLESYIDDDVTDSNGNLVIGNNWQLASVVEDTGGWSTSNSDFDTDCVPLNKDSTNQYRQRDEILNLPGGTSTQNLAAFRSDGLMWDWKYLSVREIVAP